MTAPPLDEQCAQQLRYAESSRMPIAPLRSGVPDIEASSLAGTPCAVQPDNLAYGIAQGRRAVGRKIGLTSAAVQRQVGVDRPDFGTLFADMSYGDSETVPMPCLLQPKAEAELALVLERDLNEVDATLVDVISATAYVSPAIAIVDSRIAGWDIKSEAYARTLATHGENFHTWPIDDRPRLERHWPQWEEVATFDGLLIEFLRGIAGEVTWK